MTVSLGKVRERVLEIRGGWDDDLRDAIMVAQIDEEDAAEIALVMDPAREADSFARRGKYAGRCRYGSGTDWRTWEE